MRDLLTGLALPQLIYVALCCCAAWLLLSRRSPKKKPWLRSVIVLVLGDIGRSPRMMYHAESFAKLQFVTVLVGYKGSKPVPSLLSLPHVHFLYLSQPPPFLRKLPFIVSAPFKIVQQVLSMIYILFWHIPYPPEFIVVQNPPSIPTLAFVWLVGTLRGCKVIIDWHNLGYSILALKLGSDHILVKLAKMFESYFGRAAYAHLFVTRAMHDFLVKEWKLQGLKAVLHDRPPSHFHRAAAFETHEVSKETAGCDHAVIHVPICSSFFAFHLPCLKPFCLHTAHQHPQPLTQVTLSALPSLRPDRPAVLVSSTSWTEDEDFSILLDALSIYEKRARAARGRLPRVLMFVTGKGPLLETYMRKARGLQDGGGEGDRWQWVHIISTWLEPNDYPRLLGSADLGISLHSSSSALDLPMKIVDMFGCGVPVCALDFACLSELVIDGVNGVIFQNAAGLADRLENLLEGFPNAPSLETLRASFKYAVDPGSRSDREGWVWNSWDDNWTRVVRPLVLPNVRVAG
ncbi:mannosyltransferase [Russula earlei]|uniref:Mannosyltransferase n=1 Tax=Russula earlei TaxID=71964 RepID=A0ACC0UKP1_9AGAM|nr:mannosyltransferase [Russula earlei]